MPLYEYSCGAHITEKRAGYDVERIPCPICGADAQRRGFNLVSSVIREGATRVKNAKGKYLVSDFQEASQELDYAAKRDGVEMPNAYKAGLEEAKRRGAKLKV
ncbi:hypothetical protein LCGC14_2072350 [marine sediment metagenome]|uniref:Putative regulatory protein FmdB zinc ribbon domain-containing protein n=1 Tax=marine sediment metagenome TaxID=412755 RepID=A0A0F9F5C2_9ZZZZ